MTKLLGFCNPVILSSCDPGYVRALGSQTFSGCYRGGWGARALGLLQDGRNPCLWLARGLCFPGSWGVGWGPSYAMRCERCCGLSCDLEHVRAPVLLGVSDLLGVELPLGIVELGAELVLNVCLGFYILRLIFISVI